MVAVFDDLFAMTPYIEPSMGITSGYWFCVVLVPYNAVLFIIHNRDSKKKDGAVELELVVERLRSFIPQVMYKFSRSTT